MLLVDDNQDGVELLAEALALQGHQVHVALEADQGLLLAEQHRPQLALLDIGLPDMDGHALAARMRTLLGDDCTLVALSGYSQQGDRERARAAGFAHYLVKPVDPARLLALMAAFGADAGPSQRQSPDDSAMAPLN